jgi:hypothetical protein
MAMDCALMEAMQEIEELHSELLVEVIKDRDDFIQSC